MNRSLIVSGIFSFILLFVFRVSANAQESDIVFQVKETESRLTSIMESNDVDELDKLLHPNFTVQSATGFGQRRAKLLEGFRNGGNPYSKFRPQADTVVVVNENTVITSGKEIFDHKSEAASTQDQVRYFYHVWIKYKDHWLLAGRFIAVIPEK